MASNYDIHFQDIWFNSFIKNFKIKPQNIVYINITEKCFLPLMIKRKRATRFWKSRNLYSMADGPNDFFLLPSDSIESQVAGQAYGKWFWKNRQKWDSLHLNLIPYETNTWKPFTEYLDSKGFKVLLDESRSFYFINTTADWKEYYDSFLKKNIRDLRGRINRLNKNNYTYEIIQTKTKILTYLPDMLKLYEQRRRITMQKNAFSDKSHLAMLKEVILEYEKKGWIQLSYLKGSNCKIWAYQLDFIKDGIQYHYMPTYDENYKEFSPSKILLMETIKIAFNDPNIIEFNFMRGESTYKSQFSFSKKRYVNIYVENCYSILNKTTKLAAKIMRWLR